MTEQMKKGSTRNWRKKKRSAVQQQRGLTD